MTLNYEQQRSITQLQQILNYTFINPQLAADALIWRLAKNDKALFNRNKQLEYLGDRVLNLCAVTHIMSKSDNKSSPGTLDKHYQEQVKNSNLASAAGYHGIDKLLLDSEGNYAPFTWNQNNSKRIANVMEAIFGAVFIDSACNFLCIYHIYVAKLQPRAWAITLP